MSAPQEIGGISVETLVCQQLVAVNDLMKLNYKIYYYRTATGTEVDFIMYGARGIIAIEIKSSDTYKPEMISLKRFALITQKRSFIYFMQERESFTSVISPFSLSPTLFIISLFCLIIPLQGEPLATSTNLTNPILQILQ